MSVSLSVIEQIGASIDPLFKLTPEIKPVYEQLVKWFHADPEFKGDLTKGILLMGPTGTGKSIAMRIMSYYRQIDDTKFIYKDRLVSMKYEIVDVGHLVTCFLDNAYDGIEMHCRYKVLCLDDIGIENNAVKYYGNTLDVVGHVIAERYSRGLLTLGTTNFPISVLEDKYEDRIVSRMYAMFNFITLSGRDFRKQNRTI